MPGWPVNFLFEIRILDTYSSESPPWLEGPGEKRKKRKRGILKTSREQGPVEKKKKKMTFSKDAKKEENSDEEVKGLDEIDLDKLLIRRHKVVRRDKQGRQAIDRTISKIIAVKVRSCVERKHPGQTNDELKTAASPMSSCFWPSYNQSQGQVLMFLAMLNEKEILCGERPLETAIFKGHFLLDEEFARHLPSIKKKLRRRRRIRTGPNKRRA
jgi:hypothetical protein